MLVNRNEFDINRVIAKIMLAQRGSGETQDFHAAMNLASSIRSSIDKSNPDATDYDMCYFHERIEFELMTENPVVAHTYIRQRAISEYINERM